MLITSIPKASIGVARVHVFAWMMEVEKRAKVHDLPLVGPCRDLASNALLTLTKLASPVSALFGQSALSLPDRVKTEYLQSGLS